MDHEKLVYPFYEKILKAGTQRLRPQGPLPPSTRSVPPHLRPYAMRRRRRQGGRTGRTQLHHLSLRLAAGPARPRRRQKPTRSSRKPVASNGSATSPRFRRSTVSATSTATWPDLRPDHGGRAASCAALMGMLIKGIGADHVVWGTDAVWTARRNGRSKPCAAPKFPRTCEEVRLRSPWTGRRAGQDAPSSASNSAQDVPLRDQEGGMARRSLRRASSHGLRAARPRSLEPALRLRGARLTAPPIRRRKLHSGGMTALGGLT